MKSLKYSVFLLLICSSCVSSYNKLEERSILREGAYNYKDSLYINIDIQDDLVSYKVKDPSGKVVIDRPNEFSNLHRWVLYVDKQQSIWVLSSDLGHSRWKKDSFNIYEQIRFSDYLERKNVPDYLYNDLKNFFD